MVGNNIVSYLWGVSLKILEALNHGNVILKTLIDAGTGCLNSYNKNWIQGLYVYFMSMLFYGKAKAHKISFFL